MFDLNIKNEHVFFLLVVSQHFHTFLFFHCVFFLFVCLVCFREHICWTTQRGWKGHLGDWRLATRQRWKPVSIVGRGMSDGKLSRLYAGQRGGGLTTGDILRSTSKDGRESEVYRRGGTGASAQHQTNTKHTALSSIQPSSNVRRGFIFYFLLWLENMGGGGRECTEINIVSFP